MSIEQQIKNMNQSFAQRVAEVEAENQPNLEEMRRLNDEARAKWQAKLADDKRRIDEARAEENRIRQEQAEAALKLHLRSAFLSHDAATEEDFERVYPSMRDDFLRRQAETTKVHQEATMRAEYRDLIG